MRDHGRVNGGSAEIEGRIRDLKAVIFDSDGVITDNRVLEGMHGVKPRVRSHYDGQGISLLRAIGIRVCFITNEKDVAALSIEGLVERWNSLPSVLNGDWNKVDLYTGRAGQGKVESAEDWLASQGFTWSECAVMGDDLVDVPMMRLTSVVAVPRSAEYVVKDIAHFISRRPGGGGAIRDFVNYILDVKGIDQTTLPTQ